MLLFDRSVVVRNATDAPPPLRVAVVLAGRSRRADVLNGEVRIYEGEVFGWREEE